MMDDRWVDDELVWFVIKKRTRSSDVEGVFGASRQSRGEGVEVESDRLSCGRGTHGEALR